jgi:zinc protease
VGQDFRLLKILKHSAAFFALILLQAAPAQSESLHVDLIAPQAGQFMLGNGLQVVVIPDHRAPIVTQMVWYKIGAADETRGHSGIAHFLEHLMFKGTMKNPAGKYSQWLSTIGGEENAFTSYDYTAFYQRTTKNYLPQLMAFESDRMTGLVLSDENVLPERQVILEERRQRTDQRPEALLGEAMQAALYQNHPYGIPVIGWMHEMQQLTTQDALAFYGRFYTPNNALLIVAGDVTIDEVRKLAEDTYGKVQRRAEPPKRVRPDEPPPRAARTVTYADARVQQESWARQYLVPSGSGQKHEFSAALDVLENILGGSTGRVYQKLVIERGVATGSSVNYDEAALDSSVFSFSVTPKTAADFPAIEKEIDAIIQDIANNGVKTEELDRSRKSMLANTIYAEDSAAFLARLFGYSLTTGSDFEYLRHWPQRIAAVTSDDVRNAAQTWLKKERSVTGYLVGDQSASKPEAKVK